MVEVEHENRIFVLPNGPRVLVLDSEGFLHNFNYYDTRYDQSVLLDPIKMEALRGNELISTIQANRSIILAHRSSQKPLIFTMDEQIKKDNTLFEYQGSCRAIRNWELTESNDNSYMLDIVSF